MTPLLQAEESMHPRTDKLRAVVGALARSIGRRRLVRIARFLNNAARLDGPNDITTNGEKLVQRSFLSQRREDRPTVVVDVGANIGDWSVNLLETARALDIGQLQLFAFEPCDATRRTLGDRLSRERQAAVRIVSAAASDRDGTDVLHVIGDGVGTNSLYRADWLTAQRVDTVNLVRLDQFCDREGITRIGLLKIDTEGHELLVLQGAERMLIDQSIDLVQFEYNHWWVVSRHFLRDAFLFLLPLGYHIGKVTGKGIEFYSEWHRELETFQEGNYLACTSRWIDRFPTIRWWNAD